LPLFARFNIAGVDRLKLLKALWDQQEPAIFFSINNMKPPQWNETEAKEDLENGYIDYCLGRCIKTDLSLDEIDSKSYDHRGRGPLFETALNKVKHQQ